MPVILLSLGMYFSVIEEVRKLMNDCRWKRDSSGLIIYHRRDDEDYSKPVLEFVAIQRRDTQQWALPGVREMKCIMSMSIVVYRFV